MSDIKAYDIIDKFFACYLNERNAEKVLSMVSDNIYSIGTGEGEVAVGKEQFSKLLLQEIELMPLPIKYKITDYHEKGNANGSFDCICNMNINISMPDGNQVEYITRFTGSIAGENGKMLLQSAHMSDASSYQEDGEFFPIKFASEKIKKLDKEARHELWEIFYQMLPGGIIGGYMEKGFPLYIINDPMLQMSGYKSYDEFFEDIDGLIINSIHEDDQNMVTAVVENELEKGNQYEVQYRMRKADGSYIWVHDIGRKIITQDGKEAIISMLVDISDQVKITQCLIDENSKDSLTGAYNRKGAEKRIAESLKAQSGKYIFMMIDLDNFKMLNDIYGHAEGDKALCFIAHKLTESFRKTDTVCRIGGDEFAVFISDCPNIEPIEQKIKRVIADYAQMIAEKYPQSHSSVSFGGIFTSGIRNFTELYKTADNVLYSVKKSKKGSYAMENI